MTPLREDNVIVFVNSLNMYAVFLLCETGGDLRLRNNCYSSSNVLKIASSTFSNGHSIIEMLLRGRICS